MCTLFFRCLYERPKVYYCGYASIVIHIVRTNTSHCSGVVMYRRERNNFVKKYHVCTLYEYIKCFMIIVALNDVPVSNFRICTRIKKLLLPAILDSGK